MSSCLSSGGRAIRLDLEIIKSPSTSWISSSSSPSSTLTESSNSHIAISTRKARTPRKRPNQTYNEAAALLSAACPKIFPTRHLTKPYKITHPHNHNIPFPYEPSDLFVPFRVVENSAFLLCPPLLEQPNFPIEPKRLSSLEKPCQSPGEINSKVDSLDIGDDYEEEFDAGSILDAETEEGIEGIMGKLSTGNDSVHDSNDKQINSWRYGYPIGLGFGGAFDFGYGMRNGVRAMKKVDEGSWWMSPSVNVQDITPKTGKTPAVDKKKKKVEKAIESKNPTLAKLKSSSIKAKQVNSPSKSPKGHALLPKPNAGLSLKLNYDAVLNAWSDKGSPFAGEKPSLESAGNHAQARLAEIDLFDEEAVREASVVRCKEKGHTRIFSKKIKYQVRKVNAGQRPKMKGRCVRSPSTRESEQVS